MFGDELQAIKLIFTFQAQSPAKSLQTANITSSQKTYVGNIKSSWVI